ncbi:ABC transporter ATP-binding protein [Methanosarcina sp.]|uniref:ABC transporter ATP-binding protein n=1 Tax=Methanosarcina sp. TaxID=2213 RepID=UPI002988685D|nr:ABC transporter ATP-binding protein [Methanosarcina sp.]MDW5549693.1 ABC transporter ATP-binding protein [Methanosarcina sp.]MDW5552906.1 ABC transporter ATP-binding protein [Methanosarcina sp.]MDW5558080.1 ABC transporter ATP-binding protein [Methanosarcina sp.]
MSLLKINDLKCHYLTDIDTVKAVDGISFEIEEGEILGIVGESGSGKTTVALGIMGLLPENTAISGEILYRNEVISSLPEPEMDRFRWKDIAIVFQNGLEVMNPVLKVGVQVMEPMIKHLDISPEKARSKCADLFRTVGLDPKWMDSYPHQLSGGMRQKVLLAMALSCDPKLLVLDEVTSALDAFTRKEIRDLLVDLQKNGYTMLVISHDITFVSSVASRIVVMYSGKVIETGPVRNILVSPLHPYTRGLVHSTPDIFVYKDLWGIPGDVPSGDEFEGCPFSPRCTQRIDICNKISPVLVPAGEGREIACHRGGIAGLLAAKNLNFRYRLPDGEYLQAVNNVNLEVMEGEVLAIVGQTGSGKSTLAHILADVIRPECGDVLFMGGNVFGGNYGSRFNGIQIVFQDPFSSTSNRFTVLDAIKEPLYINKIGSNGDRLQMVKSALELVRLPSNDNFLRKYCGELSGGQRQRVALARAMVMEPKLLIADEITSALDVSTSANILRLLKGLQNRRGFAMIYISHDLSLTLKIADRIAVMNSGRIIEIGNSHDVMLSPSDEYTKRLVGSRIGLCCHTH